MPAAIENRAAAVALNMLDGFGPRSFKKVLDKTGTLQYIATLDDRTFHDAGLPRGAVQALRAVNLAELAAREMDRAERLGVRLVTWFDEGYPLMLRKIHDPPPALYLQGSIAPATAVSVAVVGCRNASPYGLKTAHALGSELAGSGFNVVSGLARGIDTATHRGALDAAGSTTAILGGAIDRLYPPENEGLARRISDSGGAVVSEFPLGTTPQKHTFPRRNRVISGISVAVVVVEAGERSGALITVDHALDQGRDVFAVPGPVHSPTSVGCHRLVRDGARIYTGVDGLLAEIAPLLVNIRPRRQATAEPALPAGLDEAERTLLSFMGDETIFLDELIGLSGLPTQNAAATMLALELKGLVRQYPGKRFTRT